MEYFFWGGGGGEGNTTNSIKIFRMQKKKVLTIMNKAKKMDSCRDLFISMKILPLESQHIFSLFNACGEQ
jgi:hypothetical protein